jgi:hypothetical protein
MQITENKTITSFGKWAPMRTILTEGSKVKTESFKTFFNSTGYIPLCLWIIKIQIIYSVSIATTTLYFGMATCFVMHF